MSYTLLRECSIVLVYNNKGYRFDALSDIGFSQTFNRRTDTRKTLHLKAAKANNIVSSKNTASFNISTVFTDTFIESVFLELLGLEYMGHFKYRYQTSNAVSPKICDLYAITKQDIYKVSPAVVESLDIPMSIQSSGTMTISFSAGSIERIQDMPLAEGINIQGNILKPTPIQFRYDNLVNDAIINAGISFKQDVTWRSDRSLHDIGTMYTYTKPILNNTGVSATVTTHLRADKRSSLEPVIRDVDLYQACMHIQFKDALVSKRIEPEDIFLEAYDVAITENTDIIVEYGGLIS